MRGIPVTYLHRYGSLGKVQNCKAVDHKKGEGGNVPAHRNLLKDMGYCAGYDSVQETIGIISPDVDTRHIHCITNWTYPTRPDDRHG